MRRNRELIQAVNELRLEVAKLSCQPKYSTGNELTMVCDCIGAKLMQPEKVTVKGLARTDIRQVRIDFGIISYVATPIYVVDTFCGDREVEEWQLE